MTVKGPQLGSGGVSESGNDAETEQLLAIGSRLKALREGKETTQAEFAALLKVHGNTVGRHERGERGVNLTYLRKVAAECHVRVEWLITGEEPKHEPTAHERIAIAAEKLRSAEDQALRAVAAERGYEVVPRGGSASISAGARTEFHGHKSMEGGLPMPEPGPDFDPRSVQLLDRSAVVEMLTTYFALLDRLKLDWTPEQRAKRFLLIYERCMRSGRVDDSSIEEAIDMLS